MKATMFDGPGDVGVENRPHPMILKAHRPIIGIFCGLRVRSPEPPTPRSFRPPTKGTLSGW
jgi:hypothetical protein